MEFTTHPFEFIKPAKTSRGSYSVKNHYSICTTENNKTGRGEIAPLPDLSIDGR